MKNLRVVGLCALVVLGAFAAAQDAMTLKFAPKMGDTFKYKLSGNLDFQGQSGTITSNINDKITKSDDSGYTISSTQSGTVIEFNGQTIPGPDATETTVFKSTGEIVDIQSEQSAAQNPWRAAELNNFVYPDKPVKVGDTWTSSVTADEKKGTVAATTNYKVDSLEKIGTHDTAKIKVTFKESGGSDPASADGFVWIDVKDGSMVKGVSTWANVPMGPAAINGTFTVERVD